MPYLSPTTLTQDEQKLILRATAKHPRDHTIISLALGTGLRLGEITGLNVGDIYTLDGTLRVRVRIRREIAKGGRAGDVFLPDRMNLRDQDKTFFANSLLKVLDLVSRHTKLLQDIREIGVGDIAKNREKRAEILVDFENLQLLIGIIGRGDGVAEIEEAKIDDIALIEKILNLHASNSGYRQSRSSTMVIAVTVSIEPACR